MDKNHFVHSLWTAPMADNKEKLEVNIYLYALSLAHLKKLGCTVNLHTDLLGSRLLSGLGYNNIYLTAEELPKSINPKIFAYIKSMALQREPIGTIHIDGDVLIKKEECLNRIFNHNCDCVLQSCETFIDWAQCARSFMTPFLSENLLSTGKRLDIKSYDYNVGVIGFFDKSLKDLYIQNYQKLASELSKYKYSHLVKYNNEGRFSTPDLVLEQQLIVNLTEANTVHFVLPVDSLSYVNDRNEIAKKIGYTHLLGATKYESQNVIKIKQALLDINPEYFNKVSNNIKEEIDNGNNA